MHSLILRNSDLLKGDPFKMMSKIIQDTLYPTEAFPKGDVYLDENDNLNYRLAVAGFEKSDIKIEIVGNLLKITGHKENKEDDTRRYFVKKIAQRDFRISFPVPEEYNANLAIATFDNGILNISLKQREESLTQVVEII